MLVSSSDDTSIYGVIISSVIRIEIFASKISIQEQPINPLDMITTLALRISTSITPNSK